MKNDKKIQELLSKHLFWDVDVSEIDEEKHKKYIIKKVLQYGNFNDWKIIVKFYGKNTIVQISKGIRDLDMKTLSFLSTYSTLPKTEFLCYTTKQSMPKHWDF